MKYRLHNRLGSGGFAVQATLAVAKIDFEYDPIDSLPNQPLGAKVHGLNAWGQVPVLELADGTKITETAAILTHLCQVEASVSNGPDICVEDHPAFLRWAYFLTANVYEGILRQSYTHRYFSKPSTGLGASQDTDEVITNAIRQAASDRVHDALKCLESETADHKFLLSDRLSPCDIFLAMLYAWHSPQPDLPQCTWITTQVATHNVIRPIWEQNFHDRLDFKWHEL
ncbi:MAG: glutathione S-transferase [Pseudomonadota bacterium]